jgi:hypothetical protein
MNILDKNSAQEKVAEFGRVDFARPKEQKYSWATDSEMGTYRLIHKRNLNIDGRYQREAVSKSKVVTIARDWDWRLFGALSVIERSDGTLWVYDGGHRCRAAFQRSDIHELPCVVFKAAKLEDEAKAFIGANTLKNAVSSLQMHRAAVMAGEPVATLAQRIVDESGYMIDSWVGTWRFCAIGTLVSHLRENPAIGEAAFRAACEIARDGENFSGDILKAIYTCQKKLGDKANITKGEHLAKMRDATIKGIEAIIRRERHIVGKGGQVVAARALLDMLNKGKRNKLTFE